VFVIDVEVRRGHCAPTPLRTHGSVTRANSSLRLLRDARPYDLMRSRSCVAFETCRNGPALLSELSMQGSIDMCLLDTDGDRAEHIGEPLPPNESTLKTRHPHAGESHGDTSQMTYFTRETLV